MKKLALLSSCALLSLSSLAIAGYSTNLGYIEPLTLTIVNHTNKTLTFDKSVHSNNTKEFNLNKKIIKPGATVILHATAFVSPSVIDGLSGTLFFNVNHKVKAFIVGDQPYGQTITNTFGFGQYASIKSSESNKKGNPRKRNYDISLTAVTITLTNRKI